MTPNYSILLSTKDPVPLLQRWRGGRALFSGYTASHRILGIRVYREGDHSLCLSIECGDVHYICGPTKWGDCNFEIERIGKDEVKLYDRVAGVEIRAGALGAAEVVLR